MTIIRDPSTNNGMKVNEAGEGVVRAINEPEIEHASDDGKAYVWHSGEQNIDAADTMLLVRNDSGEALHMDRMELNGDDTTVTVWELHLGDTTTETIAGGTSIVGVNMNRGFKSVLAEATAFADETGHATQGNVVSRYKLLIDDCIERSLSGYILKKNHWLAIDQVEDNDTGSVSFFGHYE